MIGIGTIGQTGPLAQYSLARQPGQERRPGAIVDMAEAHEIARDVTEWVRRESAKLFGTAGNLARASGLPTYTIRAFMEGKPSVRLHHVARLIATVNAAKRMADESAANGATRQ